MHSLDGSRRAHDFKLKGAPHIIPPSGIEVELHKATQTKSFTSLNAGTFRIVCELGGHERQRMGATLVVEG